MIENGMPELTAEFLVLKYPERFSNRAVEASRQRFQKHGIDIQKVLENFDLRNLNCAH